MSKPLLSFVLSVVIGVISSPIAMAQPLLQLSQFPRSEADAALRYKSNAQDMAVIPSRKPSDSLGCPRHSSTDQPLRTIERVSGEDRGPRIVE